MATDSQAVFRPAKRPASAGGTSSLSRGQSVTVIAALHAPASTATATVCGTVRTARPVLAV